MCLHFYLAELCQSCNVTPTVTVGFDFAPQPCGRDVKAALLAAGVKVDDATYSQVLEEPPSVSNSYMQQQQRQRLSCFIACDLGLGVLLAVALASCHCLRLCGHCTFNQEAAVAVLGL